MEALGLLGESNPFTQVLRTAPAQRARPLDLRHAPRPWKGLSLRNPAHECLPGTTPPPSAELPGLRYGTATVLLRDAEHCWSRDMGLLDGMVDYIGCSVDV